MKTRTRLLCAVCVMLAGVSLADRKVEGNLIELGTKITMPAMPCPVTNGMVVTPAKSICGIYPWGSPSGATNTITVTDPGENQLAMLLTFIMQPTASNAVRIAAGGNIEADSDIILTNIGVAQFASSATNKWRLIFITGDGN